MTQAVSNEMIRLPMINRFLNVEEYSINSNTQPAGTREQSNEGHLEMIQSSWVYEWRDHQKASDTK